MFQTTRRRLALWYTMVTAVLLLVFASGFYLYVRTTLIERIDDTLSHVVEIVQRSLVIEASPNGKKLTVNIEASFRDNTTAREDDHIDLEWFNPAGELLWSTLSAPLNLPLHASRIEETVRIDRPFSMGELATQPTFETPLILRQVTQPVEVDHQLLGYLRVSHPWFEVTKPTRRLVFDLIWGIGLMVVTVGAIGWLLSDLAMQPVRDSYQRLKQFTADASHELRNPIASIQTNVQVALADPNPDPQIQQQHLQVVERLTRRLGQLVDELLFLARQDSGMVQPQHVPVALDDLLADVVEEQQPTAVDKGITLTLSSAYSASIDDRAEGNWAKLQADPEQLARLFTNLVSNAVQHTLAGGTVNLELRPTSRSGNSVLQITVQDTGVGIPAEALPHLFDRFYRVDPARTSASGAGSGLGLAIARAIVEAHHGHIHIDSTLGKGTTVTVTLPQISS